MDKTITIRCKNSGKSQEVPVGSTLWQVFNTMQTDMALPPVCAKVNNKVEGMNFRVYNPKTVEFLDITAASGMRTYTRSLFFVLCKAVHDLYPQGSAVIDIPVSNGYYCDLHIGTPVTDDIVSSIRNRMQQIIDAALPIHRHEVPTEEAIRLFTRLGDLSKVKLLETLGQLYTIYYDIDGYTDYYYGSLLTNTAELNRFGLEKYFDGILLRIPSKTDPTQLGALIRQDKMFDIFLEHHRWQDILGMSTVGQFNEAVQKGYAKDIVHVAEALQEKRIAEIANQIARQITKEKDTPTTPPSQRLRLILIAGPSSSGKTTTCKRLSVQLVANGIRPVPISLDDYFLDREQTPCDETGDYDFESIYALNLPLLNRQLEQLFAGEEVELPRYDFPTGRNVKSGRRLRLHDNEVLIMEGIHALNPELTAQIPEECKFRIYASALTTILLDNHNYIPTTDNRLLRRIIRDAKYRNMPARETIRRWPSVRRGEEKWIFPFQENADAMFNTAMLYELAVIKTQAEPLLEQVPENCDEYSEAYRLRKFLKYIKPIPSDSLPPTSLLREFLGGSSFDY